MNSLGAKTKDLYWKWPLGTFTTYSKKPLEHVDSLLKQIPVDKKEDLDADGDVMTFREKEHCSPGPQVQGFKEK